MKKTIPVITAVILLLVTFQSFAQEQKLKAGDKAPFFKNKTHDGKMFSLKNEVKKGAVVLIFYRGYWCPYCNKELKALNDSLSMITAKGATVVAVTPESQASVDKTIDKTKASFPIISDTDNSIMNLYGVNFTVDDKTAERYKGFGVDFSAVNANAKNNLPVPAVYIIGKDGKIKYSYFDKDYRKRPSIQDLLNQL